MKKLTIRMEDKVYERLKGYAEKCGESINDVVIEAVGKLVAGGLPGPRSAPSLKPEPVPAPATQAAIPEEIRKLPGRVKKLEEQGVAVFGYLGDLHAKLEEYHRQVSQLLSLVGGVSIPPMPQIPSLPFSVSSGKAARGKAGGEREKTPGRRSRGKGRKR